MPDQPKTINLKILRDVFYELSYQIGDLYKRAITPLPDVYRHDNYITDYHADLYVGLRLLRDNHAQAIDLFYDLEEAITGRQLNRPTPPLRLAPKPDDS